MADKINSRSKGSKNEREVSKLFETWTGFPFTRVPSSGGLGWKTSNSVGDIICTDEKHSRFFSFAIEAKFYKEIKFEHLINGNKNSDIIKFWEQSTRDANQVNKMPLVTMRYNGMKKNLHFIIIQTPYLEYLDIKTPSGKLSYSKDYNFTIISSVDWFNTEYKIIHKQTKKYLKLYV
tara:strand:+ start:300 stop:830 length:531 start_codon:yes stop_codon:yes gene_type:complete